MKRIYSIIFVALISSATAFAQAPANNCATATLLVEGGACGSGSIIVGDGLEPGVNNNNICGSGQNISSREGWYRFVATSNTVNIDGTNSNRNLTIQVFSGSCGSLVEIGCANSNTVNPSPGTETASVGGLVIGTTYYIRVAGITNNDVNLTSLCITASTPPANDNPCAATSLTVGASCTYNTFTNANATNSPGVPAPGCGSYLGGDVWFTVTVPATGSVIIDTQTGVVTDGDIAVYSGVCGALVLVSCDDFSSSNGLMGMISLTGQTPGATLWIRVWENGNDNNGTFGICAYDATVPSQNCNGAIPVCNDATFNGNSGGFGNQELSAANHGCLLNNEHQTTWFGFSPSLVGTIQLNINPTAGAIDYDFAIWGPFPPGTGCPVTGAPLRCSYAAQTGTTGLQTGAGDNSEGAFPGMSPRFVESIVIGAAQIGQVYFLLVDNFTANATPFTLDWTLSPNNMLDCTPPLPVEITTFNGQAIDKTNQVYWNTEVEVNNSHFIVERSTDAINYSELGRIEGHGNTNMVFNYAISDPNPAGTTYYKLKQVDFNGDFKYYGPIAINNTNANQFSVQHLYPNPAQQSFFIDLYSKDALSSDIYVYNSYGQLVYTKVVEIDGAVKVEIPSDSWGPGMYIVKVINDEHSFQHIERVIIR